MFRTRSFRASIWAILGFGAAQVLRLATNLILTRLLLPEAFGLMALATIAIQGLSFVTDIGITASIIQNKRGNTSGFLNTAWIIGIIRGLLITIVVLLLSVPFSLFYQEPQLIAIVSALGLTAFFMGFRSTIITLAHRNLFIGRLTALELGCQVMSISAMVIWAWISPSVWALVAGNLLNAFGYAVFSHFIYPNQRVRCQFNPVYAREIFRFGKWMFLTSTLTFLASQIDRLTLAKMASLHLVGIYSIGFMWAFVLLQLVQAWTGRVMLPLASASLRATEGDQPNLLAYRRYLVFLSAIAVGLFGGLFPPIFRMLYTPVYWPATEFMALILPGMFLRMIDEPYRAFNLAQGKPIYTTAGTGLTILLFGLAVVPLYRQFSTHGIAVAYSLSQIGTLAVNLYGARKIKLSDLQYDIAAVFVVATIWGPIYLLLNQM